LPVRLNAWWVALASIAWSVAAPDRVAAEGGGFYVGGGLGPAAHAQGWPTQIRLEEEIGYYVEGKPEGFFVGFAPSQSFLGNQWVLTFAPRFGYMLSLYRGESVTFQLGPTGTIPGVAIQGCYGPPACGVGAYFHFSVSLMARVLFADEHVGVYVRPAEVEFAFGRLTAIRYVLEAGVSYHF